MRKRAASQQMFAWASGKSGRFRRPSPAVQFARGIASRYLARPESRWPKSELVLLRTALGITIQMNRREGDFHITPSLRLMMLLWGKSRGNTHSHDRLKPAMRLTLAKDDVVLRPRTRSSPAESPARDRLLRQLTARRERRESWAGTPGRAGAPLLEQRDKAKTPPKQLDEQAPMTTLKRFQPPTPLLEPEKRSQHIRPPSAEPEPQPPERAVKPRPAQPVPDVDVNHLAERVIQAIDRRIIAQRERLGRA